MNQKNYARIVLVATLLFIYLIVLPIIFRNQRYLLNIVITASLLSCASLGVWITFSIGRINIGQGAFAGIGGYTTAILIMKAGFSFWQSFLLAGLLAALIGFLFGLVILRLKGVYFAMLTLSLTETFRLIFLNAEGLTNGGNGIMGIPRPGALSIAGITIIPNFGRSNIFFYYLSATILIIVFLAVWRLYKSRIGWIFKAIRISEDLTRSCGINIVKYRIMAYSICCFLGGIAGSLFTVFYQNIFPASFQVNDSVYFMLYCFLGGLDYLAGPILGAFVLTGAFEVLRFIQKYQEGIYACIMIALMLWLPNGLMSLNLGKVFGKRKEKELETTEADKLLKSYNPDSGRKSLKKEG
ncbi:MAG: branched-chain amino acid ABC transporter permease [Spirochaetes bacterium]|nr:MAG: branched-chain amino acid ABC transporter permease [Spirochaetota bacterium]